MGSIEALVDRQLRRRALLEQDQPKSPQAPAESPGPLRVITFSRQSGSGGRTLAARVAADLNFEFVDRQILDLLVQNTGARARLIAAMDERIASSVDLWVEGLLTGRYVDRGEYRRWLARSITALAETGDSVILGRAANIILRSRGGLHVRVIAPKELRIYNLVTYAGLAPRDAQQRVERSDAERERFCREGFGTNIDNPMDYHLVINTGLASLEAARETILTAWKRSMGEL